MKRILILTAMFACLLLFCDAAQADLYEGKYYIKVTVTDLTADGNYDSCANSAGYIVIPTINQDGSEGETWSVPVPENDWDERNVTREYKGSSDGFPTEIRLVRDDSATSTDYIKSNNKSAKSKIRFTLYVSTNYRDYYEVGSWIEYTSAGGRWSDSKTISSDMYPRRAGMGVFVSGPSTVTAPKPGKSALGYYYTTPVYDQYGAEWYFTNMGLTYSLQNAPDGMSFSRVYNGYLEVTGDVLSHFENGTRNFTIRVSDSFGHSTNEYVVLERPKCTVTLQARYGSEICDPFEVYYDTRVYHDESSDQESALAFSIGAEPIIYPSVDEWPGDQLTNTKHNLFAGWDGMPVSGRITEDTVLRAIYESEEHTWAPNSVRDRLMCTVCGYEEKYPWNRLIEGNGTQDSPYQLRRSAWYNLANAIACGLDYGEYFVLTEDCKAYFPLGTDEYPFTGVIDGNGYSLTLNLIGEYSAPAPLNITGDVIIKNLKIIGTVQGGDWCAGLVSSPGGSVLIENCEVAADITGSGAYSGGFVGHSGANAVTLRNCVFSGSVSCTGEAATFLGWSDAGAVISLHRCMDFSEGGQPLGRGSGSVSADGVFYTDPDKAAGTGSWANVGQIHDTGNYSALAGSTGFANEDFTMLLDGDK